MTIADSHIKISHDGNIQLLDKLSWVYMHDNVMECVGRTEKFNWFVCMKLEYVTFV